MKANAKLFTEAFTQVAKLVDQRSPKDVMKYVHAIAVEGQLCLTAGNTEVTICRTIPCDGDLEATLLPVRVGDIAKLSTADIEITRKGDGIEVKTPLGKSTLQTRDAADYPQPEGIVGKSVKIPASTWDAIGRFVVPCTGQIGRYATSGVFIKADGKNADIVATDSRRLGLTFATTDAKGEASVPNAVFGAIAGDVEAVLGDENTAQFTSGDVTVWARKISGRFPDYVSAQEGAMDGGDLSVVVPCELLLNAVRSVGVTTSEESAGVDFRIAEGSIRVSTKAADKGESVAEIPVSCEGVSEFTLDHSFVQEFLRKAPAGESITITYGDSSGVMLANDRAKCLIMTMEGK